MVLVVRLYFLNGIDTMSGLGIEIVDQVRSDKTRNIALRLKSMRPISRFNTLDSGMG